MFKILLKFLRWIVGALQKVADAREKEIVAIDKATAKLAAVRALAGEEKDAAERMRAKLNELLG